MATRPVPSPESIEAIGARLKATREAMRMQQAAFSRMVGIEPQAWNNYERGAKRIAIDQALKVCRATGVSLDWIYRGMSAQLPVNLATALAQDREPERGPRQRR
jgi:transcriptional regulator with XRE-family HTH domain